MTDELGNDLGGWIDDPEYAEWARRRLLSLAKRAIAGV